MTHPNGDIHSCCHNKNRSCDKELGKYVTKKATPRSDCGHRPESALEHTHCGRAGADPGVQAVSLFRGPLTPYWGLVFVKTNRVRRGQGPFGIWPLANSHFSSCSCNTFLVFLSLEELYLKMPEYSMLFLSSVLLDIRPSTIFFLLLLFFFFLRKYIHSPRSIQYSTSSMKSSVFHDSQHSTHLDANN